MIPKEGLLSEDLVIHFPVVSSACTTHSFYLTFHSLVDPRTRTRSHAGVTYYKQAAARPNLHVLTEALVEKVVFDRKSRSNKLIATGVKFSSNSKSFVVKAKKEVILSAGAFGSPQILELSGIGSKELLTKNGIDVLYENENVGENLQDHMLVPLGFEAADGQFTFDAFNDRMALDAAIAEYVANRTGVLSGILCSSAVLSYKQILPAQEKAKIPKGINNPLTRSVIGLHPGLTHQNRLTRDKTLDPREATAQEVFLQSGVFENAEADSTSLGIPAQPGSYVTILGVLEHPFSRGSVHINGSDPNTYPIIDPNYLGAEVDLEIFADIMLHVQRVARAEPLASLLKNKGHVFQPGYYELNDSNVREHVKRTLGTEYHPCCTSTMSPRHKGGVVDARLRVYGIENVRVVDASIFPLHVRGNRECHP